MLVISKRQVNNLGFLEEQKFYSPSPKVVQRLFGAMENARDRDLQRIMSDSRQVEEDGDDIGDSEIAFPEEMMEDAAFISNSVSREEKTLYLRQRLVVEELYHHLAFIARSPAAREGNALPLREIVSSGMGRILGIPNEEALLRELANEFVGWLKARGQFVAGWGTATYAEGDNVYLAVSPRRTERAASRGERQPLQNPLGSRKPRERKTRVKTVGSKERLIES